jgi:hypothetical protein
MSATAPDLYTKSIVTEGGAIVKPETSDERNVMCSPHSSDEKHSVSESKTCYSNTSLDKLKSAWNARHPDEAIQSTDPNEIWAFLRQQMSRVCKNEACWLRKLLITEDKGKYRDLLNYTFAPRAPKNWIKKPTTWLTSVDIENVMKQYEHAYPSFMFLGPAPIDFDAKMETGEYVWKDIHDFNLENMIKRGKRHFGFIFNTDPHTKSGAHWISMFVDVRNAFIFFFDSTSDDIPSEVKVLADRIIAAGQRLSPKLELKLIVNKKDHQYKNTECGMYSIFMIINVLTGKMKPGDFGVKRISDEFMVAFRKTYFNSAKLDDIPSGPSDTFN